MWLCIGHQESVSKDKGRSLPCGNERKLEAYISQRQPAVMRSC